MILSFSHENIWTTDGSVPTGHRPYFLLQTIDSEKVLPILEGVTEISEPFELDSWVNWNQKVTVRRVYITHPRVTPKVSSEYYKLGYRTFEQSVPYLNRVAADLEAQGKWPFDTKGKWEKVRSLIYDIENIQEKDWMPCVGLGEFEFQVKSTVDLEHEDFNLETRFDNKLKVTQLLSDSRNEELTQTFRPLIKKFQENHFIIGHNIIEFDNAEVYDRVKTFGEFRQYLGKYAYEHEGFQRGRHAKRMLTLHPLSFDTLHAARFIWKGESDVGYGLKQLAQKFKIQVYETDNAGNVDLNKPVKRVYSEDFGGFGRWDNDNPLCLTYNNHDIQETYGIFKLQLNAILINMFISGLNFEDVVSGSNGRLADHLSLVRGYNKIINPPMQHPSKIAKALQGHFDGELKTKTEIFNFFRDHTCTWDCVPSVAKETESLISSDEDDEDEDVQLNDTEGDTPGRLHDKLLRVVKYGEEMPDYVEYYPFLFSPYSKAEQRKDAKKRCYIAVGGKTVDPTEPMEPRHDVSKADVAAQYPTILKARNITSDVIKLSRKGEKVDGWCWFRTIYNKEKVLSLFEWKPASDFVYSDNEGYFIGYRNRGREGLLNKALTGIIKAVGTYKKKPGWNEAYQKTLKPMRNALTHGVLLALDATCQQYNIAGCAIPTLGQEITTVLNNHIVENGWKLLETDTDGTEFRRITADAGDFQTLVHEVEENWSNKLNFPLAFDVEHSAHKLFIAHKNYVTIKDDGEIKLTGNTLHSSDKPKIAEKCMKELMSTVLPVVSTKEQLLGKIQEVAYPIVKRMVRNVTDDDITIRQFVKPSNFYDSEAYREWITAIEKVIGQDIVAPGIKLEFIVGEERLPGAHGEKTLSTPIAYMWPRDYVITKDIEWIEDMIFSYFDTAFKFNKVSTKMQIKPLFGFETVEKENNVRTQQTDLTSFQSKDNIDESDTPSNKFKQERLF